MAEEIELKLRLEAADILRFKRNSAIRQHLSGKPLTRKLTSIYYDTPNLDLHAAGISLRVRRMSGQWFQSIKTAGHSESGLHARQEWEDMLDRGMPDFEKMRVIEQSEVLKPLMNPAIQPLLSPIFSTVVQRTEWQLQVEDAHLELALDVGHVVVGIEKMTPICEIEIELKSGNPARIRSFASLLHAHFHLVEENTSKAQTGYLDYLKQQKI